MTISAAVMLSLLEAVSLAPMRCAQFLTLGHSRLSRVVDRGMNRLRETYRGLRETPKGLTIEGVKIRRLPNEE